MQREDAHIACIPYLDSSIEGRSRELIGARLKSNICNELRMRLESCSGWLLQVPNEHLLPDNNFNHSRIILLLEKGIQG